MSMADDSPKDPNDAGAPRWWQSLEELESRAPAGGGDEFAEELPIEIGLPGGPRVRPDGSSRRDFFKVMGLSASAAIAACHRAPEQKIFPFTRKPDELTPGAPLWYATACGACPARCGLLVKARDGRPIKVEGNPAHPISKGAVCAIGQASLLGLYDDDRAGRPTLGGHAATWDGVDGAVKQALAVAEAKQRAIRLVVPWGLGPTMEAALDDFLSRHATARIVRFDPLGQRDAIAAATEVIHGARLVPDYRLDAADVVVSFDADFLGTFLAAARFGRQWSEARAAAREKRLFHAQIESNLSLTGGAADERHPLPPSGVRASLARLLALLADSAPAGTPVAAAKAAASALAAPGLPLDTQKLERLVVALRLAGPRALVLSGSDDPADQLLAGLANALLDNAASTAVIDARLATRPGEMTIGALASELGSGGVEAVMFLGTNPALVDARIAVALSSVPFSLSTSDRADETAVRCTAHAPAGHWLEAWSDDRPRAGVEVMAQPLVGRLHDTRPVLTSLLRWGGAREEHAGAGDYAFLKARWHLDGLGVAEVDWDAAVREGVVVHDVAVPRQGARPALDVAAVLGRWPRRSFGTGDELVLYPSVALGDGTGPTSNNGWLQELPDPISKVTWGNYAALSPARARDLGVDDGDLVEIRAGGRELKLPALRQPGLPDSVVAVAVGHGRLRAGKIAAGHGADAWPLADRTPFGVRRAGMAVTILRAGGNAPLALTQTHASQEGRELIREVAPGKRLPVVQEGKRGLWPGHAYEGHRWGMSIDLDKCTGCGACVVSCSAENNVPIVGELEVRRRREMHWLRIDRYYGGSPEAPEVAQQPMLCQHCENAPCETVCPVLATVHSAEGLNQQIYNRCVGTRYCANNCPTKVRRFNWFDYDRGGDLRRMVLNPDVVVRSRGVMEKCSMCVQRIEEGRALANREGRPLADGDIQTACQQSCPAQAIVFGDANDPGSALSRQREGGRAYHILEELNVRPQVTYLAEIKVSKNGGRDG
jgi:molybdopterin-containing oxidoreductase family iron-sulfur binding subunit